MALDRSLKYNNGHICKRNHTQVAMFYFTSEYPTSAHTLRALVQIGLKIAPISTDEDKSIEETYKYVIDILEDEKSKFIILHKKLIKIIFAKGNICDQYIV